MQLQLKFIECILGLKNYTSMAIPFEETSRDELRFKIQHNYNEIKIQSNACHIRLDKVLAEVGRRNAALFSLLDRTPSNRNESSQIKDDVHFDEDSFENRYINQLIPQRQIYQMNIPIQSATRKSNADGESSFGNGKRIQKTTSERYKAQYVINRKK